MEPGLPGKRPFVIRNEGVGESCDPSKCEATMGQGPAVLGDDPAAIIASLVQESPSQSTQPPGAATLQPPDGTAESSAQPNSTLTGPTLQAWPCFPTPPTGVPSGAVARKPTHSSQGLVNDQLSLVESSWVPNTALPPTAAILSLAAAGLDRDNANASVPPNPVYLPGSTQPATERRRKFAVRQTPNGDSTDGPSAAGANGIAGGAAIGRPGAHVLPPGYLPFAAIAPGCVRRPSCASSEMISEATTDVKNLSEMPLPDDGEGMELCRHPACPSSSYLSPPSPFPLATLPVSRPPPRSGATIPHSTASL